MFGGFFQLKFGGGGKRWSWNIMLLRKKENM
jgi:hypothetical protein